MHVFGHIPAGILGTFHAWRYFIKRIYFFCFFLFPFSPFLCFFLNLEVELKVFGYCWAQGSSACSLALVPRESLPGSQPKACISLVPANLLYVSPDVVLFCRDAMFLDPVVFSCEGTCHRPMENHTSNDSDQIVTR